MTQEGMGGKVIVVNLAKRVSLSRRAASGPGTVKRGRFANLQGGEPECRVCVRRNLAGLPGSHKLKEFSEGCSLSRVPQIGEQ